MKVTLWKNNRLDGEYSITLDEIKEGFVNWMKTKDKDWLTYYCTQLLRIYLSDKDGLSSTFNMKDFEPMAEELMKTKWEYLSSIGIK
jgi:hypothetical protein